MSIKINTNYDWVNEHNSVKKTVLKRYEISNDPTTPSWKAGFLGIQQMLSEALSSKERVRSYGGKWSLSDVAICGDIVHNTKPLTFYAAIGKSLIKGKPIFDEPKPLEERLFFVQCGVQIMQLNTALEEKGLTLPTTGASNGQTIAGAISTGTHGSALKIGAMQDFVRAIHVVTNATEHFLLQPSTNTPLKKEFAAALGATEIIDDTIFNSALVSFGSFGVIHGYVIETMPLYILDATCIRRDFKDATPLFPLLNSFSQMDTTAIEQFLKQQGISSTQGSSLHQVDLTINPYSDTKNIFLRGMFKLPYSKSNLTSITPGTTRVGDDIISIVGRLSSGTGNLLPLLINNFLFAQVQNEVKNFRQTPRNIFGDSTLYKSDPGGTSIEMGVAISDAEKALSIIMPVMKEAQIPGVIGVRFLKPTKATIGFTRFSPLTCTIEIPGIDTPTTRIGYQKIFDALDAANITFTSHWGQIGDYSPIRLQKMYGIALSNWIAARKVVLPDAKQRYMFTNDFMKRCGLDEPMPLTHGAPIA